MVFMGRNILEDFLSTRKAKNKSLGWVQNYCSRDVLEKELVRRKQSSRQEVYDFLEEEFLYSDYDVETIEKISAFLDISPIEVIEWDKNRLVPETVANRFLVNDSSWLQSEIVPGRVSNEFLFKTLLREELFYKYPNLVAILSGEFKMKLFSLKDIDLMKFPKDISIDDLFPKNGYYDSNDYFAETLNGLVANLVNNNDCESLRFLLNKKHQAIYYFRQCCEEKETDDFVRLIDRFPKEFILEKVPELYLESLIYKEDYSRVMALIEETKFANAFYVAGRTIKRKNSLEAYYQLLNKVPSELLNRFSLYDNAQDASVLVGHPLVNRLSFVDYSQMVNFLEETDRQILDDLERDKNEKFIAWKKESIDEGQFWCNASRYREVFAGKSLDELLSFLKSTDDKTFDKLHYLTEIFFSKFENNGQIAGVLFDRLSWKSYKVREKLLLSLIEKTIAEKDFDTLRMIIEDSYYLFRSYCENKKENVSMDEYLEFLSIFPEDILNEFNFDKFSIEEIITLLESTVSKKLSDHNYTNLVRLVPNEVLDRFLESKNEKFMLWCKRCFDEKSFAIDVKYYKSFLEGLTKEELMCYLCNLQTFYMSTSLRLAIGYLQEHEADLTKTEILNFLDMSDAIFTMMEHSSSSELRNHKVFFLKNILNRKTPLEDLNNIEEIFLQNNLPFIGKIFKVVEFLYPTIYGDLPSFKKLGQNSIKTVIFADLLKAAFGSNNRSLREYLKNIENGYNLFCRTVEEDITYDKLSSIEKNTLDTFCSHLIRLYFNTAKGKDSNVVFDGNTLENISKLKELFSKDGKVDYDLPDRIVRMFCHFSGIDTVNGAKEFMARKVSVRDAQNRESAKEGLTIVKGDLIKGLNKIEYLSYLLQNGILAKEFLNDAADSDRTPFDTDVSMVLEDITTEEIDLSKFIAGKYGPVWIVLKKDARFIDTYSTEPYEGYDFSKLELYHRDTEKGEHCGIRTGFASSDIDCFLVRQYDPRIGLEIAMNGFYIPVYNTKRKLLFSPKDYDALREKMSGLSYYNENDYDFSQNLNVPMDETMAENLKAQQEKISTIRSQIQAIIRDVLKDYNLGLESTITGKLDDGKVELCETGSSSRGTGVLEDYDFDFIMRIDNAIFESEIFKKIKSRLLQEFGKSNDEQGVIYNGDFRLKKVVLQNAVVDIDISFVRRTNKISYSTEMCLNDRLNTIKNIDEGKYFLVLSNIITAKTVLKKAGVYKPSRKAKSEGGLGGVGIENWILQHGGSFYDAAKSFLEVSENLSFDDFKMKYSIWDFGENHLAIERSSYLHDNFVDNMNEEGYLKMKRALGEYLKTFDDTFEPTSIAL